MATRYAKNIVIHSTSVTPLKNVCRPMTKAKEQVCICPVCDVAIKEQWGGGGGGGGEIRGQDSVECEGPLCRTWLLCGCAGLSKVAFEAVCM